MLTIINIFLFILGVYFFLGFLFGIYFIIKGAPKIDPLMHNTKKRVRVLLFPGIVATWPFIFRIFFKSKTIL